MGPRNNKPSPNSYRFLALSPVIISFGMLQRMASDLCDLDWSVIIVDEAQRMKNPRSKALEALSSFSCINRFALTVSSRGY
jgi:SNF2 family DNA or RNA helicase